jgi:Carboxypeptidase regulatory-like domain
MSMRRVALSVAVLLAIASFRTGHSQVLYGTLTGNVTDPANAAVPGVSVEATNQETNVKSDTTTDDRGIYRFTNLQPGQYKVSVTAKAFRAYVQTNIPVQPNEIRRVDVQLQLAQTTETVEVSSAAVVLQTDKADIHTEVTQQEVTELPYNGTEGKNFQSLLFLLPGAGIGSGTNEANSEAGNPQRAITVYMNGVSSQANNTRLDGTPVSYPWLPVNIAYVPPGEAIMTVNVSSNAFDAEQGAAGGAAVNVMIKSGTNQLHGSIFERHSDNQMAAINNYFVHPGRLAKNIFNQYGVAIGGPVWIPKVVHGKDKLFFFADFQGTKRRQYAATPNLTLPTAAERTGDFTGAAVIYDPLTGNPDGTGRTAFANNAIPTNRIDSAAAKMASLLPALTRPNSFFNNYDAYGGTQYNRENWDFKGNYNPTSRAMVWGRYSFSPMDIVAPLQLGPAGGDAFSGGNAGHAGGRVTVSAAGFTYAVSPTLVIDGNQGYTRQNIGANGDVQDGHFGTDVLHIPGTNGPGDNYAGIPAFFITGIANLGNPGTGSPFQFRDNQYLTAINVSKTKGAHNIRAGFEYDKYALNHFQPQGGVFQTPRGSFRFDGTLTSLKGGAAASNANSWAQFLLGFPSETGKATQLFNPNSLRFATWSFYARDSWAITRNLTINYGLRWEYYPIYSHDHYGAVRFDVPTASILIGGQGGVPWDTGASANKKDFGPRLGAAYRLGPKTVIRSGYGISIDPDNMRNQRNQYPNTVITDYPAPNTYQFVNYTGVANSDGASQVRLSDGIPLPSFPNISVGTLKSSPTPSLTTYLPGITTASFPKDFNRGYYQSWNFFIQREFSSTLVAEIGYAGTHGVHIHQIVNLNAAPPNGGTNGRQLAPFLLGDLNQYTPFGDMTYNGLQSRVRKRIGSSLIGASYTYSKSINTGSDNGDGGLFRNYPLSYSLNKSVAGFSRTHTFQFYYVYNLPFGKGHTMFNHGVAAWILGGWALNGNLSRFSGLPFGVGTAASAALNAPGQGANTAYQINPAVQILGGHDTVHPYFDGSAFANPAGGVLGTTGRNILSGPGLFALNQSISRTFAFHEDKLKFQLVGESFNLTNTVVFANPQNACCWNTTATPGTSGYYNGFAVIGNQVSQPRYFQVGGYLRF